MKTSHIVYNILAVVVAGMTVIAALTVCFLLIPKSEESSRDLWYFMMTVEAFVGLLLLGGAAINLARRKVCTAGMLMTIVGFGLTVWLIPLAVWGIVMLVTELRRPAKTPTSPPALP